MKNKWLGLAASIFLVFTVTGCSNTPRVQIIKPQLNIPEQMYQCEENGIRPQGEIIMESEVARYISSLEFTMKDCKTRLKELAIIVKCFNDTNCDVDKLAEYMGLVREIKKQ